MTAQLLISKSSLNLTFDGLVLLPASSSLSSESKAYFTKLANAAEQIAASHACSSVLVGQGSESDDFGDVAIWLGQGDFGPGKEVNVLGALGLDAIPTKNKEIPELINTSNMQDRHCFRIQYDESIVVFFLVGKVKEGWGGLAGAGVWT